MPGPSIAATNNGSAGNASSHTLNLPSAIQANDVLFAFVMGDRSGMGSATGSISGWTPVFSHSANNDRLFVGFRKIATGSEGSSATISWSGASPHITYITLRIADADASAAPEVSSAATANSSAPNPPSINPSWGAARSSLFLAVCGVDVQSSFTTPAPSGYSGGVSTVGASGGGTGVGVQGKQAKLSTEDPGAFGTNASSQWSAFTIAIRGKLVNVGGDLSPLAPTLLTDCGPIVGADGNCESGSPTFNGRLGPVAGVIGNLLAGVSSLAISLNVIAFSIATGDLVAGPASVAGTTRPIIGLSDGIASEEAFVHAISKITSVISGGMDAASPALSQDGGPIVDAEGEIVASEAILSSHIGPLSFASGDLAAEDSELAASARAIIKAFGSLEAASAAIAAGARVFIGASSELQADASEIVGVVILPPANSVRGSFLVEAAELEGSVRAIIKASGEVEAATAEIIGQASSLVRASGSLEAGPALLEASARAYINAAGEFVPADAIVAGQMVPFKRRTVALMLSV